MTMPAAIPTHEQAGLVALSVAVAIVAGYLALDLAQRSAGATEWSRRGWIAAGGVTIGLGIWSMHFIGMLALKMAMPVSYDLPLVALSMLAAVGGAVVALAVVARPDAGTRGLFFSAGFLAPAIASMHYLGMASMEMGADISWNAPLVALSVLIGFGASLAALFMVQQLGRNRFRLSAVRRLGAGLILGLGISGLHYTAMAAATFHPTMEGMTSVTHHAGLDADGLVVFLALGAAVMLGVLIVGAAADQRRAAVAIDLALVAELARGLNAGGDPRPSACEAVLELTGADFVLLVESGEDREPELAASAGLTDPPASDYFVGEGEGYRLMSTKGDSTFVADLATTTSTLVDLGGVSAFFEPLILDRQPIGLIAIVYTSRRRRVSERTTSLLGMLATEAALTIDRKDLLERLDFMARRDELTGLVNRRVLRETLDAELQIAGEGEGGLRP